MPNFIDPLTSLSFALHQGPGQFAVLLGSGVSRSAGIPTGWGVTLDLLRKLPNAPHDSGDDALLAWCEEKYGNPPTYSSLVGGLANSEVERRNLLGPYFEPTEEERNEGLKMPTEAHRAIAKMVGMGLLRVIITTNFDRLMERALTDEGITADVVYHESGIAGAMPYAHSKCAVIKVHGDYVDTRLRNTEEELVTYPPELRAYLLHILDEHGLVVCGWSADYDAALVDVIISSPNRRFGMYWMHTVPPGAIATNVVAIRRGTLVEIKSADSAFRSLLQRVEALREMSKPRPIDVATLVASAKRFIPRPEQRIQLEDLVNEELDAAMSFFDHKDFTPDPANVGNGQPLLDEYRLRVSKYEAGSTRLCALASVLAYHGTSEQVKLVARILNRLARPPMLNTRHLWTEMRGYPAFLVMYVAGTAAVAAGNLANAAKILRLPTAPTWNERKDNPFILEIAGGKVLGDKPRHQLLHTSCVTTIPQLFAPLDDYLAQTIPKFLSGLHITAEEADSAFAKFHYMLQLAYMDFQWEDRQGGWAPPGRYYLHGRISDGWSKTPQAQLEREFLNNDKNPMLQVGFFEGNIEQMKIVNSALRAFLTEMSNSTH